VKQSQFRGLVDGRICNTLLVLHVSGLRNDRPVGLLKGLLLVLVAQTFISIVVDQLDESDGV
jgi:hypothetical protein